MAKNKFTASMFDKLKDAFKKGDTGNGSYVNIMKFPAGHTYTLRLIPNVENVDDTFYYHVVHSWKSNATGTFTSALSLQPLQQKDPIAEVRWKLYKEWKDANPNPGKDDKGNDIKFRNPIDQKEQWFVNVYVVDDPACPENNGTVKVLKMGPQLKKIVDTHMSGDRAEEFGMLIFDLGEGGADFKIVAQEQGEFTTFITSYFTTKSKLKLSDDEIDAIYEAVHDLKAIIPVKTATELEELLATHFYCGKEKISESRKPLAKQSPSVVEEDDDQIPMDWPEQKEPEKPAVNEVKPKTTKAPAPKKASNVEQDVDDLIAGLDND